MQTKIVQNGLKIAAFALAVMMMSPIVAAQQSKVEISGPAVVSGITPGSGGENVNMEFTFTYENPGTGVSGATQAQSAQITVTPSCPSGSGFFVTGPGAVIIDIAPAAGAQEQGVYKGSKTVAYAVGATREAAGLTPTQCTLTAVGEAVGQAGGQASAPYPHPMTLTADFYGAMAVTLGTTIQRAAPQQEVPFVMDFTNFGNAATRVKFSIADESDRPTGERWQHVLPTEVLVGSASTGADNTGSATFQVSTPYKTGWNNEVGSYRVTMDTEAFAQPDQKGNTMTANFLIRVRGVYVPGFEAVALVGSLLGALAIVRRRE